MLLHQVTGANLERLKHESDIPDREFFKKMLARTKTENPLFAALVGVMADTAKAQRLSDGSPSPDDIHNLVIDIGMLCIRALELAALDGESKQIPKSLIEGEGEDNIDPLNLGSIEAEVFVRLYLNQTLGVGNKNKKDKDT